MRSVGIRALKNKLSEYVRLAASGETVLVTDRDRVVAELGPPRAGRGESVDDVRLAELVRGGLLSPALLGPDEPPPVCHPCTTLADLLRDLDASREDR
jgi:antitoxin (DNA-binding transcriptional repressor) of toxin-antitoxin stability system